MAKEWKYKIGEDEIVVKNNSEEEAIYVNGALQDKKTGLTFRSEMTGKLPNGDDVKVCLGGVFSIKCNLFVNHKHYEPVLIDGKEPKNK